MLAPLRAALSCGWLTEGPAVWQSGHTARFWSGSPLWQDTGSVKHGWQRLPVCGRRVTLGKVLFCGGTLCLCLRRRLEGWADLVLREPWCVLSKHSVQDKNTSWEHGPTPRAAIPLFLHYSPEQPWEGRAVTLCSWAAGSLGALSSTHSAWTGQPLRTCRVSPLTWHLACVCSLTLNPVQS